MILACVYPWPLKPFDRPHPVRGYFNDPRISGKSRAFHFGVDVAAKDGTAVYAVTGGKAHVEDDQVWDPGGWKLKPCLMPLSHLKNGFLRIGVIHRRLAAFRIC